MKSFNITITMKTNSLIALACALFLSPVLQASAAVPFQKGKTAPRPHLSNAGLRSVSMAPAPAVVVDEDFSRFSDGSEDNPGEEIINPDSYYISEDLTAQPGWTGKGLHPAGGSVLVTQYLYDAGYGDGPQPTDGYISTPPMPLAGTMTLTFRAKAKKPGSELWVALCDDYNGPTDSESFYPDGEWREYSFTTVEGSMEDYSYIQFRPYDLGEVFIDDVKMTLVRDRIATPYGLPATNVSPTEFIANWEETGAPGYLLTVYSIVPETEPVTGTVVENFDAIVAGSPDRNITPGWQMTFGGKDVSREEGWFASAPQSFVFDDLSDMVESPEMPYPLSSLSFWVRPSSMEQEGDLMSLLRVEVYHADTEYWENISHIPNYWMEAEGAAYGFSGDALGNDVVKVRLSMPQKGLVDFYVDDLTLAYQSTGRRVEIMTDEPVEASGVTVRDIDPAGDTYYFVKAVDGDIVSPASYRVWVDGISGLKVSALPATDVTGTSFVANWQPLGHCTSYKVEGYAITVADEDMTDVVVLEESFDRIDAGTVDNPGSDWNPTFDFSAAGWADTGWCATQPAWIEGMAGTSGTSWYGAAGLVYSPLLDLGCNAGEGFDVDLTVMTTVSDLSFMGMDEPEGVFALVLRTPSDVEPLAWGLLETPEAGLNTGRIHVDTSLVDDLSGVYVAFMNKSGTAFYVDHVRITQNLRAGEELNRPFGIAVAEGTSVEFTGLDPQSDHAYIVTGSTYRDFVNYVSVPSDLQVVRTKICVGVDAVVESRGEVSVVDGNIVISAPGFVGWSVYTPAGMAVASGSGEASLSLGSGIYIVKAGAETVKLTVR